MADISWNVRLAKFVTTFLTDATFVVQSDEDPELGPAGDPLFDPLTTANLKPSFAAPARTLYEYSIIITSNAANTKSISTVKLNMNSTIAWPFSPVVLQRTMCCRRHIWLSSSLSS